MGRPVNQAVDQQCTLVSKADDHMVLNCPSSSVPVIIPRRKSDNVSMQQRVRCESCDPLPIFKAADGTPIAEPEVSYGQPWRWAPERMLARDLRFRLCGNATECEGLNPDVWKVGNFWPAMMHGQTTKGAQTPSMHDLFRSQTQVEDPAWSKQWLSCTNNGSGVDCQGTISKANWMADRAGTCKRIVDHPEAAVDLTICQLDATLDQVCYTSTPPNCSLTLLFFYSYVEPSRMHDIDSSRPIARFDCMPNFVRVSN